MKNITQFSIKYRKGDDINYETYMVHHIKECNLTDINTLVNDWLCEQENEVSIMELIITNED